MMPMIRTLILKTYSMENVMTSFNRLKINTLFYILLLVGFTIVSMFPEAFSLNSRIITVPFRAVILSLSIVIMLYNVFTKHSNRFGKTEFFFIAFWVFYSIKAVISFKMYAFSEPMALLETEVYLRIIGITFIPALAVLTIQEKDVDYALFLNYVYYILFFILLLNAVVGIEYNNNGRSSGFMSMYSISFGHLGVSLALLSIYRLLHEVRARNVQVLFFLGSLLGLYILYASGTRSPLIAFILCLCFMLYLKNKFKYLGLFLLSLCIGIISLFYFRPHYNAVDNSSSFFSRVTNMIVSGDSSGRGGLYQQGIKIFTENPIFGGRILYFDGMYPHTIFIEILMATGVVGLALYLGFFKNCVIYLLELKKIKEKRAPVFWVSILWLQYFVLSLLSYNLHSSPEIWYLTAMILVLGKKTITEIK
jgi:O-antigen ligase